RHQPLVGPEVLSSTPPGDPTRRPLISSARGDVNPRTLLRWPWPSDPMLRKVSWATPTKAMLSSVCVVSSRACTKTSMTEPAAGARSAPTARGPPGIVQRDESHERRHDFDFAAKQFRACGGQRRFCLALQGTAYAADGLVAGKVDATPAIQR